MHSNGQATIGLLIYLFAKGLEGQKAYLEWGTSAGR
jgi:hypothetical protein